MADPTPTNMEPILASEISDDEDEDQGLGSSIASSSVSLTSSVMQYREENGRTYHAYRAGRYVLPNDEVRATTIQKWCLEGTGYVSNLVPQSARLMNLSQLENDRLDLQHHLFTRTFDGKLFICPAGQSKQLGRVLDAGTGTGIWSIDFADEHPEAHVIGVDLSPIQPSFAPPNVTFYVDDIEDEWTYRQKFDFIYSRMLTASISDWPKFIQQSYNNLSLGGWMEIADILLEFRSDDNTIPLNCMASKWGELMLEAAAKWDRPLDSCKFLKQQMQEAGFTNIVECVYKWPSCSWPRDRKFKEMGLWTYENLGNGASGLSMALFTRALGWSAEEVEVFLVDVRNDMKNRSIHGYWPLYVVYGQKPEARS